MRKINLDELSAMAVIAYGRINKIYLHWTAGRYGQFFTDYHISIDKDGSMYAPDDLLRRKSHTWMRNTRAVAIALCCGFGAKCYADGTVDFGEVPPTKEQIEAAAKAVAVLCKELGLACAKDNVMTHCEAAEIDGYGPSTTCERWDLWKLPDYPSGRIKDGGEVIRGKAIWYMEAG